MLHGLIVYMATSPWLHQISWGFWDYHNPWIENPFSPANLLGIFLRNQLLTQGSTPLVASQWLVLVEFARQKRSTCFKSSKTLQGLNTYPWNIVSLSACIFPKKMRETSAVIKVYQLSYCVCPSSLNSTNADHPPLFLRSFHGESKLVFPYPWIVKMH